MLKLFFKKFLPKILIIYFIKLRDNYFDGFSVKSYSQEGEDMILSRIFSSKTTGFYVDIGAHHPFRFSNTYFFYKKGWKGINIDAMPKSMDLFNKFRPRDINLELAISDIEEKLTFFSFNEPALNSFSRELSFERNGKNGYFIESEVLLETQKLSSVLAKYLPLEKEIDFLSIDVEGLDVNILRSNDWIKYRPKCILIEILNSSLSDIQNDEICNLLKDNGYVVFAKSVNTIFFLENKLVNK